MELKRKEVDLLTRAAEAFDLPADVMALAPRMELLGGRELFLDNHRGILSYSTECIEINAGALVVRVTGAELALRSLTEQDLRVGGRIDSVELVR